MTNIVLLVTGGMLENLQAILAQKVAGILMPGSKVVKHIRVEGGTVFTHLAYIRHLSGFVGVLHVLQEHWLILKGPLTYLTLGR